jgi:hypothetical protein
MKKRIMGAKIACLDINLQKARMQLGVQILVEDPEQLEEIRKRCVFLPLTSETYISDHLPGRLKSLWREYGKSWLPVLTSF